MFKLRVEQGVTDFNQRKQNSFEPGQVYATLSWVKT